MRGGAAEPQATRQLFSGSGPGSLLDQMVAGYGLVLVVVGMRRLVKIEALHPGHHVHGHGHAPEVLLRRSRRLGNQNSHNCPVLHNMQLNITFKKKLIGTLI